MKKDTLTARDMALVAISTAVISVCSWISIPLTVPITFQTFAVFVTAGLLGKKRGLLSVALYILLGIVGIPVFSGFSGGAGVILAATGGYIIGFLFTALIVGFASDKRSHSTMFMSLSMILGLIICYAFGTTWFMYVYARNTGEIGLLNTLSICVLPFLIPDTLKIILALLVMKRLRKALYKLSV